METPNIKPKISGVELEQLKRKLEAEGEEYIKRLHSTSTSTPGNNGLSLVSNLKTEDIIAPMLKGEKEFVEKTGRFMTYSEMREMYG